MTLKVAVGLQPFAGKLSPPHDVVTGVAWNRYLYTIAFGLHSDQGAAYPLRYGASVIFGDHECTLVDLIRPFRDQYGIERHGLVYLIPPDYDKEVSDRR